MAIEHRRMLHSLYSVDIAETLKNGIMALSIGQLFSDTASALFPGCSIDWRVII